MNKKEDSREIVLRKDSALISINNCPLQTMQRKSINALLYIAKRQLEQNENRNQFETSLKEINQICGFKIRDLGYIKSSLRELQEKTIEYNITKKNEEEWGIFPLLAGITIKYRPDLGFAKIEFGLPFQILNVLKDPKIYAYIDLSVVKGLKTKYSIALYEIARDYYKINSKKFAIEDLKKILGVGDKYKYFGMFEKRVLIPAIEDVNNKTEFLIEYSVIKEGRKKAFVELFFGCDEQTPLIEQEEEQDNKEILDRLKFFGVGRGVAKRRIKKFGSDKVRDAIAYTERQMEEGNILTSPAQCFNFALNEGLGEKSPYDVQKDEENRNAAEKLKEEERREKEIEDLKEKYDIYKFDFMAKRFAKLSSADQDEANKKFENSTQGELFKRIGGGVVDYKKRGVRFTKLVWYCKENNIHVPTFEEFVLQSK